MIATLVVAKVLLCLIGVLFGLFAGLVLKGLEFVGVEVDYDSNYFMILAIIFAVVVVLVMLWVQVIDPSQLKIRARSETKCLYVICSTYLLTFAF